MTENLKHHWVRQGPTWLIALGVCISLILATVLRNQAALVVLCGLGVTIAVGKAFETVKSQRGTGNPARLEEEAS